MNFAVFVSGCGSNLQAIIRSVRNNEIKASLAFVFSDQPKAYALTRARRAKISTCISEPKDFSSRELFDRAVVRILRHKKIDFVVLAGFMRILSPYFVRSYKNRILNIHPSRLPQFKGAHAIRDAFNAGVASTGVTVHLVDEHVDHGPVLVQQFVEIKKTDTLQTLEKRIHRVEHKLYPEAISLFVDKLKQKKKRYHQYPAKIQKKH